MDGQEQTMRFYSKTTADRVAAEVARLSFPDFDLSLRLLEHLLRVTPSIAAGSTAISSWASVPSTERGTRKLP